MNRLATVLAVSLAITTAACGQAMKQPDIKLNPHPKMRYEITLTIEDAPGPFESVTAYTNFETDTNCVPEAPITAGNYGSKYPVGHSVLVAFHTVGANTYQGTMYMDLLQDEDYYGLGVCHWRVTSFSVPMKAGEVTFGPAITGDEIASRQPKVEYFPKSYFGDPSVIKDTHTGGMPMSESVARAPGKFFSTTLTPAEHFE
jgi:hypothetical protein